MREIKCRGYNEEYDKWIIGSYVDGYIVNEVVESNEEYIVIGKWAPVDVESVGQCTGVKDKNGVEIYEGDVCRLSNDTYYSNHYFNTLDDWKMVTRAVWEDQSFKFQDVTDRHASLFFFEADQDSMEIKIIGNIYENKELMEG